MPPPPPGMMPMGMMGGMRPPPPGWGPMRPPHPPMAGGIHYPSQDPTRMGAVGDEKTADT